MGDATARWWRRALILVIGPLGYMSVAAGLSGPAWAAPIPSPSVGATPSMTPSTTPTPSPENSVAPLMDVSGSRALWFIGIVAAVVALLWAVPLVYDTWQANKWRTERQEPLLQKMLDRAGRLSVEEIRQIVSAMDTQPRGTQGLTQSLLALIVATFVGLALVAALVSRALDSSELRKTIVTALLSILASISGFYFGARTAQTATEIATRPPESRGGSANTGPLPVINVIDPTTGPVGAAVTLHGSGFSGATVVNFGTAAVSNPTVVSDETITVNSPQGEGTVNVTVTTPAGTSPSSSAITYTYKP